MPFSLSATNDEAAALTGLGAFASTYLLGGEPLRNAIGIGILAGLAVVGYTGYTSPGVVAVAPAAKA